MKKARTTPRRLCVKSAEASCARGISEQNEGQFPLESRLLIVEVRAAPPDKSPRRFLPTAVQVDERKPTQKTSTAPGKLAGHRSRSWRQSQSISFSDLTQTFLWVFFNFSYLPDPPWKYSRVELYKLCCHKKPPTSSKLHPKTPNFVIFAPKNPQLRKFCSKKAQTSPKHQKFTACGAFPPPKTLNFSQL